MSSGIVPELGLIYPELTETPVWNLKEGLLMQRLTVLESHSSPYKISNSNRSYVLLN